MTKKCENRRKKVHTKPGKPKYRRNNRTKPVRQLPCEIQFPMVSHAEVVSKYTAQRYGLKRRGRGLTSELVPP